MRFSLIVPVYNVERYVIDCLESIKRQSFNDYEVIIVNDGSTDSSVALCNQFIQTNPDMKIRLISQHNHGLLLARRTGIRIAAGEYFVHIDSDDMIREDALELLNDVIQRYSPDLILFRGSFSKSYSKCQLGSLPWKTSHVDQLNKTDVLGAFLDGYITSIWVKAAKKTCVDIERSYQGFEGITIGEDQLQSIHLLDAAERIIYLDEALYYYRENASSSTSLFRPGKQAQYGRVKEAIYKAALDWDSKYPGHSYGARALKSYLANAYYDIRKSAHASTFTRELDELRATPLFQPSLKYLKELRLDQRLFCKAVVMGWDGAAFVSCRIFRWLESALRRLRHVC